MSGQTRESGAAFEVKHTTEVHRHAQNLTHWSQEYEQTSAGPFEGRVREFRDTLLQAFEEVANRATTQYCQTWEDGVWLGMPAGEACGQILFMGRALLPDHLMVASGAQRFDLSVPAGVGLYGLVVRRSEWQATLVQLGLASAAHWCDDQPQLLRMAPMQRHRLGALLREALANLQAHPQIVVHPASVTALRAALLTVAAEAVAPARPQPPVGWRWRRRLDLVHRARERVLADPHGYVTVEQLCSALHVTRRTLQNCFQDVLGLSPAAYLRTVRLNRVRQELLEGEPGQTVVDVAARWGFWHMGHFAHEYRRLFAESPSQTLRRRSVA
ncbi:MAG: helix-turn-helix domain-containing protein [Tepidimonas sp.]|uniref:helix-turn-helix domain-containing protein n=1 Tax=Tepidimonas sp. TaxID=2002775 RepID=UPI00298F2297|nr:helix-turn-helix domain-containing protein [Tepidimonas sp.]MDW8336214.1 helix-turn-helix domain-containing protein [Tepidimonas sp.]